MSIAPWTKPPEPKLPEPSPLSAVAQHTSDTTLGTMHIIERSFGTQAAKEMATGSVDGASRYLDGEGSVPAVVSKTVN